MQPLADVIPESLLESRVASVLQDAGLASNNSVVRVSCAPGLFHARWKQSCRSACVQQQVSPGCW